MANLRNDYSDSIKFYIASTTKPALEVKDLIGWSEYGLDAARNTDYHGTLTSVTKTLGFVNEAKDYILDEYNRNLMLSEISLIVSKFIDIDGKLAWYDDEPVFADFNKLSRQNGVLSLPFNSDSLMTLIDSYEDTEFEVERLETVDNAIIPELEQNLIEIKGRSIESIGQANILAVPNDATNSAAEILPGTKIISEGPSRHNEQTYRFESPALANLSADEFFYSNWTTLPAEPTKTITVTVKIEEINMHMDIPASQTGMQIIIKEFSYNTNNGTYSSITSNVLYTAPTVPGYNPANTYPPSETNWETTIELTADNESAFLIMVKKPAAAYDLDLVNATISINEVADFNPSPEIRFNFTHDILARLMYIVTGRDNAFYSSWLGRTEKGYASDGFGGLIGFISGLWVRDFKSDSERYKSPKISLSDALKSLSNCFTLGAGIERINNIETLVLEELRYFYRDEVLSPFTEQINNVERITDEKSFYSNLTFGYEKSGNLDQQMGLDEPNVKSNFITPIKKSRNKFEKLSKIRADEYKLEELRRKSVLEYPSESLTGDEDNWFLDIKRSIEPGVDFEQVQWEDRLSEAPTGIHSVETFRSMLFTPMRIMLRASKIFMSGIHIHKDRFVNFTSSSSNRELSMKFIDETETYKESQNVQIEKLGRPIFKNDIIKFTHPYNEELRRKLFGKTTVNIDGVDRLIPNFYFKQEWINEDGDIERGYFLKYEYSDNPTFEFQLANEDII